MSIRNIDVPHVRSDNRHGPIDAERVDGRAEQVLILHGGRDLGGGDYVLDFASASGAEDNAP